jgi:chromosome partitioning protein
MKRITIATQKGGVGKSTLTMLLATALAVDYGFRVIIIDADPQQSIMKFRDIQDTTWLRQANEDGVEVDFPYPVYSRGIETVHSYLDSVADEYNIAFIDIPGRADHLDIINVLSRCDVVLVPLVASLIDRDSTTDFLRILDSLKTNLKNQGVDFKYFGVANRRSHIREEADMEEQIDELKLARIKATLNDRAVYKRPSTLYSHLQPSYLRVMGGDKQAATELRALCEELIIQADLNRK